MCTEKILELVRKASKNQNPNKEIIALLMKHRCDYLLIHSKEPYCTARHFMNHIIWEKRIEICSKIFDQLIEIPYALIKGPSLAKRAFQSEDVRVSRDIDILISKKNLKKVKQILKENGFVQGYLDKQKIVPFSREEELFHLTYTHQAAPFLKEINSTLIRYINIDLNHNILWGEEDSLVEEALSNEENIYLFGKKIKVLSPTYEFISLCLHHYKDMNLIYLLSQNGMRMGWFCDIYFYLKNNRFDLEELCKICQNYGIAPYIYYCIYYTKILFPDVWLDDYLNLFYSVEGENLLKCFGLDSEEKIEWKTDFLTRLFSFDVDRDLYPLIDNKIIEKIEINKQLMH